MKYVSLILFLLVLAAPFAMRRALVQKSAPATTTGGARERLVVITPHNTDIRREFAHAFGQWHQDHYGSDVDLDLRVPGGTNDIKRQLETTYREWVKTKDDPAPGDFSVVWGGGDYFFNQLKKAGILQPMKMSPALLGEFKAGFPQPSLAGVLLYDQTSAPDRTPTPQWIGVCLSSFGVCYNPDLYHALGISKPTPEHGWSDLTDPRLNGYLALADPAHSASAALAYQMVIQHKMAEAETAIFAVHPELKKLSKKDLAKSPTYRAAVSKGWSAGMSELLKIAANARYFTDSSTLVPMDVSRGESAAGIAIDFYSRVTEESVGSGRMHYFAPLGATAITPDPVAILAGTSGRKLELSEHFVEFLLSPEGQRLWILKAGAPGGPVSRALRRPPIRQDVYADRAGWADDFDPFNDAQGFNQRGEWMALFDDTRPIWVAAWIDSRDELRDAYGKILAVADPVRRQSLIDQLADLPIKMSEVQGVGKLAAQAPDVDLWRAKMQIDWARRFREHYQQIANLAQ